MSSGLKLQARALHWVFKIGDRTKTVRFFENILGMKILRHEEFEEGCAATCNGPYNGRWSKTMVGYGPESNHFVVELTYNYEVNSYKLGNDFRGIAVHSADAEKLYGDDGLVVEAGGVIRSPDGYPFSIVKKEDGKTDDPVSSVSIAVSDLKRSQAFWRDLLGMKEASSGELSFGQGQASLKLVELDKSESLDHGTAFGRIAFAVDTASLPAIESRVKEEEAELGCKVQTPLVKLDTPGKATVEVVILTDPDGYEICFVGEEGFDELSQVDPKAKELLHKAMEEDKSNEWFAKKGLAKKEA